MFDTSFNHFKSVCAHQFFVAPADDNYFMARFTRIYGMPQEFWWQSLQAVEKLLKAGLVLNGVSVKNGYGHDLEALWKKHKKVFGVCALTELKKPPRLSSEYWIDRPLSSFIHEINWKGHPESRYGLISRCENKDDLFKLDQLIFELRRRTIGLDWIVGQDWPEDDFQDYTGHTYRELIAAKPNCQIRKPEPPSGPLTDAGEDLTDIWYVWNFEFFRSNDDVSKLTNRWVAPDFTGKNSHLYLLFNALSREQGASPAAVERVQWLLDNIKLNKEIEQELQRRNPQIIAHCVI